MWLLYVACFNALLWLFSMCLYVSSLVLSKYGYLSFFNLFLAVLLSFVRFFRFVIVFKSFVIFSLIFFLSFFLPSCCSYLHCLAFHFFYTFLFFQVSHFLLILLSFLLSSLFHHFLIHSPPLSNVLPYILCCVCVSSFFIPFWLFTLPFPRVFSNSCCSISLTPPFPLSFPSLFHAFFLSRFSPLSTRLPGYFSSLF